MVKNDGNCLKMVEIDGNGGNWWNLMENVGKWCKLLGNDENCRKLFWKQFSSFFTIFHKFLPFS